MDKRGRPENATRLQRQHANTRTCTAKCNPRLLHINPGLPVKSIHFDASWKPDFLQCYYTERTMMKQPNLLRRETGQVVTLDNTEKPQRLLLYLCNKANCEMACQDIYVAHNIHRTSSQWILCNGWEKPGICVLKYVCVAKGVWQLAENNLCWQVANFSFNPNTLKLYLHPSEPK